MLVHAKPNTQPGGVHGALFNSAYQVDVTPLPVNSPPRAKAPKFIKRKMKILAIIATYFYSAVVGAIITDTLLIELAGNPPCLACSRTISSLGAL